MMQGSCRDHVTFLLLFFPSYACKCSNGKGLMYVVGSKKGSKKHVVYRNSCIFKTQTSKQLLNPHAMLKVGHGFDSRTGYKGKSCKPTTYGRLGNKSDSKSDKKKSTIVRRI